MDSQTLLLDLAVNRVMLAYLFSLPIIWPQVRANRGPYRPVM